MALSKEEEAQLQALERQLTIDDPSLARAMTTHKKPSRRARLLGILVALAGLAVMLGALVAGTSWTIPIGVVGFAIGIIGAFIAFRNKVPEPTIQDPDPGKTKKKSSYMDRMERRWDARQDGKDR